MHLLKRYNSRRITFVRKSQDFICSTDIHHLFQCIKYPYFWWFVYFSLVKKFKAFHAESKENEAYGWIDV